MFDLIIRNGMLIDGSGSQPHIGDVAICDGKIVSIGKGLTGASQIIDATGLAVTPGFIDSHSHSDKHFLKFPEQKEKVEQGITTCIAGQCGTTPAPVKNETGDGFYTMGRFLRDAAQVPQGCNALSFVGHKMLRLAVMGNENRAPTDAEMQSMKELLCEAMDSGAIGISFGLMYNPSCYASTEEMVEFAKVVASYHGLVSAHIRNEGDFVEAAVQELIEVLRRSGARGVYSHHKACGKANHGKVRRTMALLEAAVEEGIEIWCDAYPYIASSTSLASSFISKEDRAGSAERLTQILSDPVSRERIIDANRVRWGDDLSFVMPTVCSAFPEYNGLTIPQIAQLRGTSQYDTVLDIVRDSRERNSACFFSMCEEDVRFVLSHPRTMICTDSAVAGGLKSFHPRLRGSFPRALGKYVREDGIVSLPEMIRKMTSLPASVYRIPNKGLLKEGFDADICIFDPQRIRDRAEFTRCTLPNEGLNYVLVAGRIAVHDGVSTGRRDGQILLRNKDQ